MFCSCLIARNMLPGLKTCLEVANYMRSEEAIISRGSSSALNPLLEDVGKTDMDTVSYYLFSSFPKGECTSQVFPISWMLKSWLIQLMYINTAQDSSYSINWQFQLSEQYSFSHSSAQSYFPIHIIKVRQHWLCF